MEEINDSKQAREKGFEVGWALAEVLRTRNPETIDFDALWIIGEIYALHCRVTGTDRTKDFIQSFANGLRGDEFRDKENVTSRKASWKISKTPAITLEDTIAKRELLLKQLEELD